MTASREKSDWAVVILAITAGIAAAAHVGKAPPALPLIRSELGLSIVQAGWVVSMIAAMAMAVGMMAGMVADRIGHRRQLIGGLLIMAAGGTMGALADNGSVLLASRFLESLGFIAVAVAAPSLIIMSILPHHRQVVLGVWSSWVPAGIAISMLISPVLLEPLGWRALWMFWVGVMAMLALVLLVRPSPVTIQPKNEVPPQGFWDSLKRILNPKHPGPMILAVNFLVFAAQWGSMMMWIPSFLVEERGLPVSAAALLGGLAVAVNVPGNLAGSWLLHHGVRRRHIIGATHLVMGFAAIGVFSGALPDMARFGLVLLFSHAAGYLPAAMFASVPVHAPSHRQFGATNGLLLQGSNTGNFFGPPAVAAVVAALGNWNGALWLILACAGVGLLSFAALTVVECALPENGEAS